MLELEEARRRIFAAMNPLPTEAVRLVSACGRVLAGDIASPIDLPPFDNSAMDGYAVRSEDVRHASATRPVTLKLAGRTAAGAVYDGKLGRGTCVRVFTGSPLPAGADAVVMQEDTRVMPQRPDVVEFLDGVKPWENTRLRGEDVKAGAVLLKAGEQISPGKAGLLAATGIREVQVHRQPLVGLLATGSELVEAGKPLPAGRIYESNRISLAPLLVRSGAVPHIPSLVPDTLAETTGALERAFADCDAVITSGGVSVGEFDFVKRAFEQLGGSLDFWRVAIKPGKPFVFGRLREKFLFGLPGNPVSAVVTFLVLVRPALLRWQGANETEPSACAGVLDEPLANRGDRRHFIRVRQDEQGKVRAAGTQASHILSSLAQANGLVEVPPETTLPAGAMVRVIRLDEW